jgi:hypothetical protein
MKLNNKQKQFLFENNYITAKVLDALTYKGWENYFIKNFDFELAGQDRYGLERLYLKDKKSEDIEYTVGLIFQDDDYEKLLGIKSK